MIPDHPELVILETPAGFEPNSAAVAGKIKEFLDRRLQNYKAKVEVIPARKRGTPNSPDNLDTVRPMLTADEILTGPGSPTYAARQLRKSLTLRIMQAGLRLGKHIFLSSASTLAFSRFTMPVYEIYKVGEDLHWKDGADFLAPFGLKTAVIPHWNNNDGGTELDTSRCYLGQDRFQQMVEMLPEDVTVIGIDEHTALVFDFGLEQCKVLGNGTVTILKDEAEIYESGSSFPISELGDWKLPELDQLPAEEVELIQQAMAQKALAEAEELKPTDEVMTLADERWDARNAKDWAQADKLRDELLDKGWKVLDGKEGYELEPV
ncbi:MAG: cysteinyl-tRNA synthetase [Chloroflexota bacterium]